MSRMVVLDTETTGLNPEKNSLIEIGAIMTDKTLADLSEFSAYVKPREFTDISAEAMKVNQIDLKSEEFKSSALIPEVAIKSFDGWLKAKSNGEDLFIAGWNPSFDVRFVRWYYDNMIMKWPFHYRVLDVQSINAFYQDFEFTDLKSVRSGQKHRALDDAFDVLSRLQELARWKDEANRYLEDNEE